MEHIIFQDFLSKHGLKLTKERIAVLKEIFSIHGHFEPEQLYIKIKASGIKASRASVYRTLNLVVESGLVERITRSEKGNVYEHTFGHRHHDHMICTTCGTMIEFYSQDLEEIQKRVCSSHNFEGRNHTLEIRGLCRKCRKQ